MITAVEYIKEKLMCDEYWYENMTFDQIFEKAKEMEKEQRQEDTNYGYSQGWDDGNQNKEPMRPEVKQQEQ